MNDTELRELDAWIAEHVMGVDVSMIDVSMIGKGHSEITIPGRTGHSILPQYTTAPHPAMAVLEKCAEKTTVAFRKTIAGYRVWSESNIPLATNGETLPLAIAKFAKALFSK